MADTSMLANVKTLLNITGPYHDDTISGYIDEVTSFLIDEGVRNEDIDAGIVARGVADLWNYGAGEGKFSQYFIWRSVQLSYRR